MEMFSERMVYLRGVPTTKPWLIKTGQHVWDNSIRIIWLVLAFSCNLKTTASNRIVEWGLRCFHGSLLFHVGAIHIRYVFWHTESKQSLTICVHELSNTFLSVEVKEATGIAQMGTIIGMEGTICGLSAVYLALAEVLN